MSEWVLRGDINFLEYGGRLIRQDDNDPAVYEVIEVLTPWDSEEIAEGFVRAWAMTVDLDDSWIDIDEALKCIGVEDGQADDYTKVDALCSYHGSAQWDPMSLGDDGDDTLSVEELAEILKARGAGEFA